jgi:hypothetical protein
MGTAAASKQYMADNALFVQSSCGAVGGRFSKILKAKFLALPPIAESNDLMVTLFFNRFNINRATMPNGNNTKERGE